ncbi:SLC13 family permease [Schleiferiaceae bacterium]|nr:SLC13 family permease [Schleiferiaceae bacterium]
MQIRLTQLFEHTPEMSHYFYVVAFSIIIIGLLWGRFNAMHVFAAPVLFLILSGFMGIKHIYAAAINPSILTVMALIALTGILKKTLPFHRIIDFLGNSSGGVLIKSSLITATLSGFINNTPVVALLIPLLKSKAQERNWNVSRFLMPLSFAAVAGGTITLIGTSTNLVLNGLMIENGIEGFKFWDFLIPGLTVTGAVLLTTIILAPIVLKQPKENTSSNQLSNRQYTTELKVIQGGTMDGKTVKSAGLRNLNDLFLAEIYRNGEFISPVNPKMILQANDTLFFTGALDQVNELLDLFPKGLKTVEEKFEVDARHDLLEVIVPNNSDLIGRPLKQTNFRARYDAVIVGAQREGQPLKGKIGRIALKAGDLLLLSAGANFTARNELESPLITINQHKRTTTSARGREQYFLPSLLVIVLAALFFNWSLLLTVGLMLILGVGCGITHSEKLKREFNLELYFLLILSVAFGSAIVDGGHAQFFIEQLTLPENPRTGIILLFGITMLLTNFMTNVSAVAIAFPIAVTMMQHYNLGHLEIFLPVAFGASASFLTPSSYQTHLMVMGPGNYSNQDFVKLGIPVLLVYTISILCVLL